MRFVSRLRKSVPNPVRSRRFLGFENIDFAGTCFAERRVAAGKTHSGLVNVETAAQLEHTPVVENDKTIVNIIV